MELGLPHPFTRRGGTTYIYIELGLLYRQRVCPSGGGGGGGPLAPAEEVLFVDLLYKLTIIHT